MPIETAGGGGAGDLAERLRRFRASYGRFLEWVVGALMVILFVEVTAGVIFRAIGASLIWYDEIASVLLAWLTFYGSALASVKRAHIGCPELVDKMPWPMLRRTKILAQILVIVFFLLLGGVGAWITPILATDALVSVPIPMSIVQSVIPISSALIVVAEVTHLMDLFIARHEPTPAAGHTVALADGLH
ncbi:MAG: TRAP transporter small permease [Pseudomonadota bacterium]|nr:TRAP transporter small permease [Pseudomonadota bacterium]